MENFLTWIHDHFLLFTSWSENLCMKSFCNLRFDANSRQGSQVKIFYPVLVGVQTFSCLHLPKLTWSPPTEYCHMPQSTPFSLECLHLLFSNWPTSPSQFIWCPLQCPHTKSSGLHMFQHHPCSHTPKPTNTSHDPLLPSLVQPLGLFLSPGSGFPHMRTDPPSWAQSSIVQHPKPRLLCSPDWLNYAHHCPLWCNIGTPSTHVPISATSHAEYLKGCPQLLPYPGISTWTWCIQVYHWGSASGTSSLPTAHEGHLSHEIAKSPISCVHNKQWLWRYHQSCAQSSSEKLTVQ